MGGRGERERDERVTKMRKSEIVIIEGGKRRDGSHKGAFIIRPLTKCGLVWVGPHVIIVIVVVALLFIVSKVSLNIDGFFSFVLSQRGALSIETGEGATVSIFPLSLA